MTTSRKGITLFRFEFVEEGILMRPVDQAKEAMELPAWVKGDNGEKDSPTA